MGRQSKITRDDQWSEGDVRRVLTNIFHVSVGTVTPHMWTSAVARLIRREGVAAIVREVSRSFNEAVESIGRFEEAIDEDEYVSRFEDRADQTSDSIATALLNDLLPRARKWSSVRESDHQSD